MDHKQNMAASGENKAVNETVEFMVGDILVDTKYDYGGHVMVVVHLDPIRDRVIITHPGFTFPDKLTWNKYSAFHNKAPKDGKSKYILRWIGPSHAVHHTGQLMDIRQKLVETINRLHFFSKAGFNLDYSRYKGACMYIKNACFISNRKISHQKLESIQKSESFVCSSYAVFLWKYVLEQFAIPDELRGNIPEDAKTLDDIGFPIDPYECLPRDILQFAKQFPQYWEKIPYYTRKTEFIELKELTNKRISNTNKKMPNQSSSSSRPSYTNISSIPYTLGGKQSRRRRQMKYRGRRRTIRK